MRRYLPVVVAAMVSYAAPFAFGQTEADPSAVFLNAFTSVREAETFEKQGNFRAALAKYRYAGSLLDQLHARHPGWQTSIVDWRRKKTSESIALLEEQFAAEATPEPTIQEHAPVGSTGGERAPSHTAATGDPIDAATRQIRAQIGQLERQLQETRVQLETTQKERDRFARAFTELKTTAPQEVSPSQMQAFQETEKSLREQIEILKRRLGSATEGAPPAESGVWKELEEARAEAVRVRTQLQQAEASEQELLRKLAAAQESKEEENREQSLRIRREIAKLQESLLEARADRQIAEEQGEIMARKMSILSKRPDLSAALADAQRKANEIAKENEKLDKAAKEADKKLADLVQTLEKEQKEKGEIGKKLTDAEGRLENLADAERKLIEMTQERNKALDQAKALGTQLEEKGKETATLEEEKKTLAEEKKSLAAERDQLAKERDAAQAGLKKAEENSTDAAKLLADNQELAKKLEATEASLTALKNTEPEKEKQVAALRKELADTTTRIAELQKTSENDKNVIADLHVQLDTLTAAAEGKAPSPEQTRLSEENELLRGIVLRRLKDQLERDRARTAISDELARLQVRSKAINDQVTILSRPMMQLTEEERILFKAPQLEIVDNEEDTMIFSIAAPEVKREGEGDSAQKKRLSNEAVVGSLSGQNALPPWTQRPDLEAERRPAIPENLQPLAKEAREKFDKGEYAQAEALFSQLTREIPTNIHLLSNLGMARYRAGKLKEAEETFRKVLTIEPDDAYSHTTLGIVYHAQSKYDQAIEALTRSIAVNPRNPTAHNYLGVTAAKKGWHEAARKEIQTAIEIDPTYADAHFNLAVVYATAKPVDKENARKHYRKAVELGVAPDPNLENLIR